MMLRAMAGMLLTAAGCAQAPVPEFDGQAALGYVREQLAFGPRIPGTEGHRRMGDWLEAQLRTRADTVIVQPFDHMAADGTVLPLRNFIARFRPEAAERILLLAHWDTRPRADAAGSRDPTLPVPGANDGGSGVAVLLGLADALRAGAPPVGVDLLFVDGEDYGSFSEDVDVLIGPRYYARHPLPGPRPLFAILLDMVGDRDLRIYQEGYSLTGAPEVVDRVWRVAADLGHGDVFVAAPRHTLTDDHVPLQQAGFRAINVIDFDYGPGHAWWHTPDDTLDKVSAESLAIVGRVMLGVIHRQR